MHKWSEYQEFIQDGKFDVEEQHGALTLYRYFDALQWGNRYALVLHDNMIMMSENYPEDVLFGAKSVYNILNREQ